MLNEFNSIHWIDEDGNPAGGHSTSTGVLIVWQNGPLGRGDNRREPNGAFVETVIAMVKDRIQFYQDSKFSCEENKQAIKHLEAALDILSARTKRRELAGVEGTHKV